MKHTDSSKGGCPSKPASIKRGHVVTVKLTGDEYTDLCGRIKNAGCRLSEFIRHAAFRHTIESRLTDEEREITARQSPKLPAVNMFVSIFDYHVGNNHYICTISNEKECHGKGYKQTQGCACRAKAD